jgi:hypothetical protein
MHKGHNIVATQVEFAGQVLRMLKVIPTQQPLRANEGIAAVFARLRGL